MGRSGMVQKLMREMGPSVSTPWKYDWPFWMVVEAFQLKRMHTRSLTEPVPIRVCP